MSPVHISHHLLLLPLLLLACHAGATDLTLRYTQPAPLTAQGWEQRSLPIGNGRLGGTVFGGLERERLAFNDISLWTGDENVKGSYQAFGNVYISLPGHNTGVSGYERSLDLEAGEAAVTYRRDGTTFQRLYLASHPAQVIILRLTADKPGAYTGEVELADMHNAPTTVAGNVLTATGTFAPVAARGARSTAPAAPAGTPGATTLAFESQVQVLHEGGSVAANGNRLAFTGCDALTILLAAGTDYVLDYEKRFRGPHPHERLRAQLQAAAAKPFDTLRQEHRRDYQALFGRVQLDLGQSSAERRAMPTDQRLASYRQGNNPGLESLMFQYGRYLLMSCSRDLLPANLQGLWNDRNNPPWQSDYHTNINVQMNYWLAEPANLSECARPLLAMVRELRTPFQRATAAQFPPPAGKTMRGWTVRTEHNPFGAMSYDWNMGGNAWYAQHFWEHYAFTLDKQFLREVAYPLMKELCEFWEDHLKTLPDGRLAVPNGWSPEHGPRGVDGVTYDQMLVWDLLTNTLEAMDVLDVDRDYRAKLLTMRQQLVAPKIGRWGQLQEWMDDRDDPNEQHRHTSHLWGVFPGRQISRALTPDLAAAAAVSLKARGESGDSRRSWTWPWRSALWARLGEAENAHRMVAGLLQYNTLPNLWTNHPPFQMDGNFGITAGICEMLLQSHAGEIHLLPALPQGWPTGAVSGLRARGAFEASLVWRDGKLAKASVKSTGGTVAKIRYGEKVQEIRLEPGQSRLLEWTQ
jgi:alpha-L-fucosidase 2